MGAFGTQTLDVFGLLLGPRGPDGDTETDPARSQTDRRTEGISSLPSGDSSWTYVPVRYLCTSADLPLARLPTMPWERGAKTE